MKLIFVIQKLRIKRISIVLTALETSITYSIKGERLPVGYGYKISDKDGLYPLYRYT